MNDNSDLAPVLTAILRQKPYASRISRLLFETLLDCDGKTFRAVEAELDYLEQAPGSSLTRTKKQKRLHGEILGNLKHTHYFTSEHLIENIRLHWEAEANQAELLKIKEAMGHARASELADIEIWALAGQFAETLAGAYRARASARKLTGEWIVYACHEGKNYYLDLAVHGELSDEQALFDRLKSGCPESAFCFPEPFENLTEKSE